MVHYSIGAGVGTGGGGGVYSVPGLAHILTLPSTGVSVNLLALPGSKVNSVIADTYILASCPVLPSDPLCFMAIWLFFRFRSYLIRTLTHFLGHNLFWYCHSVEFNLSTV